MINFIKKTWILIALVSVVSLTGCGSSGMSSRNSTGYSPLLSREVVVERNLLVGLPDDVSGNIYVSSPNIYVSSPNIYVSSPNIYDKYESITNSVIDKFINALSQVVTGSIRRDEVDIKKWAVKVQP